MKISLIAAMAENRVIGLNNQMPWHLSADLKRFKQITLGSPIIMGRKTFASIGRPLPGRTNIILSRNPEFQPDGCIRAGSVAAALDIACQRAGQVFVIGGAELYADLLPLADTLYLTLINKCFAGDTYFPELELGAWTEREREDISDDPLVDFNYSFVKLEKSANFN